MLTNSNWTTLGNFNFLGLEFCCQTAYWPSLNLAGMRKGQKTSLEIQWAIVQLSRIISYDKISMELDIFMCTIRHVLSYFQVYRTIPKHSEKKGDEDGKKPNSHLYNVDIEIYNIDLLIYFNAFWCNVAVSSWSCSKIIQFIPGWAPGNAYSIMWSFKSHVQLSGEHCIGLVLLWKCMYSLDF